MAWTLSSDSVWMTVGPPASGTGNSITPFSISQNTGAARSGTVTLKAGYYGYTLPMAVTQSGPTVARPSNVSVNPNSGSGATQMFAFQYYDPAGFGRINYTQMSVDSIPPTNSCLISFAASNSLALLTDDSQRGWLSVCRRVRWCKTANAFWMALILPFRAAEVF